MSFFGAGDQANWETDGKMIPERMEAVYLTGYGSLDKLDYRTDAPVPSPRSGEVLVRVAAAGMNNTDINTRTGWYNPDVSEGTTAEGGAGGFGIESGGMGGWKQDIRFPRIQGADCAGRIAKVGDDINPARVGERVVCAPYICGENDADWLENAGFLGAEHDGAFAQYVKLPARNVLKVPKDSAYSDAEIATLPCSGGTAMNMLKLAAVKAGDIVLVTGASGGVGTFLVQIAAHLGAEVVAVCAASKAEAVRALGATAVINRSEDNHAQAALATVGGRKFTVIADVVGGDRFPEYLSLLGRGGRYVVSGAIAGPMVALDLRTLYLKNLSFFGSTVYLPETFAYLVDLLNAGALKPVVAKTWPLKDICEAQKAFLRKEHVGNMVLLPQKDGERE